MEKRTKESKKRLNSLVLLIAFTAIILIASTYAWFTTQRNVSLTNLKGVVEVADGMEISLDAENWDTTIDLSNSAILKQAYATHKNIYPVELLPVSTIGEPKTTTSDGERLNMYRGNLKDNNLTDITSCDETKEGYLLDDTDFDKLSENAVDLGGQDIAIKNLDYPSYFAFDVFIRNTSRGKKTDGTETNNLQLDKTSSLRVLQNEFTNPYNSTSSYKGNAESGLQNCLRVGFAMYKTTAPATSAASDTIGDLVSTPNTISQVSIWEPNSNAHVPYIVTNNNTVRTKSDNLSLDGSATKFEASSRFFTFGVRKNTAYESAPGTAVTSVTDIYNWGDTPSAGLAKQYTIQTDSPVPKNAGTEESSLDYTIGGVYNLKTVAAEKVGSEGTEVVTPTSPADFTVAANRISRMRIYLWLEGQDVDCINWASFGGGIEAIIGLTKDESDTVEPGGAAMQTTTP